MSTIFAVEIRCNATNRQGEPCGFAPEPGKQVCRYHGGLSLSGPFSPTWKDGRQSKYAGYAPARIMEAADRASSDPDLTSVKDDIGLIEGRICDLLSRVEHGGALEPLNAIREATKAANKCLFESSSEERDKRASMENLLLLVNSAEQDYHHWNEIQSLVETRRKLCETETKRKKDIGALVDAREAMAMVMEVQTIVAREVKDGPTRARISAGFDALFSRYLEQRIQGAGCAAGLPSLRPVDTDQE
jgi:hypothetical protein